jgi:hypothetical protein
MSPGSRNSKRIGSLKRTSPCRTSLLNLGMTPRVSPAAAGDGGVELPRDQRGRNYLPLQINAMRLISKCLSSTQQQNFEKRLQQEVKKGKRTGDVEVCGTPIMWICEAFDIHD